MTNQPSPVGGRIFLQTEMEDVTVEFYQDMPITAGRFCKLVEKGFYNGTFLS